MLVGAQYCVASADDLLLHRHGSRTAWGALDAVAKLADVNLQFRNGAAQGIAVHAEFTGGAALIAFILLQNSEDETFLELAHTL